jgi:DNA (cytosine-5)-methyltransferase 1
MGYHRAGFDVVGVDIKPQPRYPFEFVQADAMTYPSDGFDAQHASPPCQDYSRAMRHFSSGQPRLIDPVRRLLDAAGLPWVIENVPGAPMRVDLKLCGCMFGLGVGRERWFETSWREFDLRPPCYHPVPVIKCNGGGGPRRNMADRVAAMGIDWMTRDELSEAIPPAYTEHIGARLLGQMVSA